MARTIVNIEFSTFQAHLAAAVICPSDEDSRTFTINCASGDMLKLRATDARARQEWVNSLRAIAEIHTKVCYDYTYVYVYSHMVFVRCRNTQRVKGPG